MFTAPDSFSPIIEIQNQRNKYNIICDKDNHFSNMLEYIKLLLVDKSLQKSEYKQILVQSEIVHQIKTQNDHAR